jgi:hypothetical protein
MTPTRTRHRLLRFSSIASACLLVSSCSYMETVMNRKGQPDSRVQLGIESGTVLLARQEIPNYTCAEPWLFKCDRSGSVYACACTRRP